MKKGENTVRYDIVMVTYNSMKWLRACVAALAAVQYPLEELHLVFADNGSTDGTLEELRRMAGEYPAFGGFTVAENGANLGFGAACNRGAAKGSAPLLFFLNLDTEVWPDVFLRLDEAAVRAPQETAAFECRQLPYETGHHIDPVTLETSWASGAALAVRRAAFTSVGGLTNICSCTARMWTSPGGCAPEDTGCNTCPQRASPIIPMRMAAPNWENMRAASTAICCCVISSAPGGISGAGIKCIWARFAVRCISTVCAAFWQKIICVIL